MDENRIRPAKKPFFGALAELMEAYGIADYAIAAHAVDGKKLSNWVAGVGDGVVSDRERAGQLYFELEHLQASIIRMTAPK